MKRIVSMLCILCMILCTNIVFASNTGITISGENEFVKKGNYVDYSVSISNNTGISAYMIYIDCDTNIFSVEYDDDEESYKVTNGTNFNSGTIACNTNGTKGYVVSWYLGNGSIKKDGELFTLRLYANETAQSGEYPINIRYSEKNTLDVNMNRLALNCVAGNITIAPTSAHFLVESAEVIPGEEFNLKVKIDSNPGIAGYMVYLLFDRNTFSLDFDDDKGSYNIIDGDISQNGTIYCSAYKTTGYRITWFATTETVREGTMFELPLKVAENASLGDYNFQIKISSADIVDEKGVKVPATLSDGVVSVKDFYWKDASIDYAEDNVEVSVTPMLSSKSTSLSLFAASYDSAGRMIGVSQDLIEQEDSNENHTFTLNYQDGENVKLFLWQVETQEPICKPLVIQK